MRNSFVVWVAPVFLLLTGAKVQAKDFVFDIGGTTIPSGTGAKVIQTFDPKDAALAGTQGPQLEAQLQPAVDQLVTQLKQKVDAELGPLDFGPLLRFSARSQAAASKAPTIDYASWMRVAGLTLSGATGFAPAGQLQSTNTYLRHISDNISEGEAPPFGFGGDGAITLGLSLEPFHLKPRGLFDPSRLSLWASAFVTSFNINGGEATASNRHFGVYGKYQMMRQRTLLGSNLLRWGGLNVATGVGYSRLAAHAHTDLPGSTFTQPENFNGQTFNVKATWEGTADFRFTNEVYTWPIEAATSIELAYAFTFYGGMGVDFNFGQARLKANARAPVTVAAVSDDGTKNVTLVTPLPTLSYNQARKPQVANVRGFAGLQLGAAVAGLFIHAAVDSTQAVSLASGLRFFW